MLHQPPQEYELPNPESSRTVALNKTFGLKLHRAKLDGETSSQWGVLNGNLHV